MAAIISGTVEDADGPAARLIRLYLSSDGSFVDEVTSDAGTGEYQFTGTDLGELYDVVAFDPDYPIGGALIYSNVAPFNVVPAGSFRYWRIDNITSPGGDLEVSEIRAFESGVDVTSGATYTGTATDSGAGSDWVNWKDNDLFTKAYWATVTGKELLMDFGVGNEKQIDGIKQGGYTNSGRYMSAFRLSYSTDGSGYTVLGSQSGLSYPGNVTLSSLYSF